MTMTLTQGRVMNSLKKTNRSDGRRINTLPRNYAALLDEHGSEVEITEAQIRRAIESIDDQQIFPFGSSKTPQGRWVASAAPARKLHS